MKHKIALMVSNLCTLGGTERVTANLSADLAKFYDCYIITQWDTGKHAYPVSSDVKTFNLYPQKRRLRHMIFDAVWRIRKYVKQEGIEVLIVVGGNNGLIPFLVRMITNVKLVYCEHSSIIAYRFKKETIKEKMYRHILRALKERQSDYVVTLTEQTLRYFLDKNVVCSQIYNMVDEALFDELIDYRENNHSIVTVGRVEYNKGIDFILDVAQKVLARHPDWRWDIYGDGEAEYKEKIAALIRERGLEGRLTLCGNRRDIYDLYQNYGIYVMTSRYEGLPMVLLEAKVKKLPLVSFDIDSGPSDIIEDGVSGYLVPPFDTDAMAERICELIEHPELRQRFSDHAWDNIDKFRKEAVVQKWVELIDELAGDAKAGS